MNLSKDLALNMLFQFWGAAVAILMVPYYLNYLGIEAYALVGLSTVLQSWISLFDMGFGSTFGREVARWRAEETPSGDLFGLFLTIEKIFCAFFVITSALLIASSDWISAKWLNVHGLPLGVVSESVMLMGMSSALRLYVGLYRSGGLGLERPSGVNVIGIIMITIRYLMVVPFLAVYPRIDAFFLYQFAATVVELLLLRWFLVGSLDRPAISPLFFSFRLLKRHGRFFGGVAFAFFAYSIAAQADKLLLSKYLSLEQFGYYVLAVLVAGGVALIASPFQQVLQPRLAYLAAKGDKESFTSFYHLATQLMVAASVPVGVVLAVLPSSVIFTWTGNKQLAAASSTVLTYYALGYVSSALLTPVYCIQIAFGYLRLHVAGTMIFSVILLSLVCWVAPRYGAEGTAKLWFAINFLFLLFWVPLVHRKLLPDMKRVRYVKDLLPALFPLAFGLGVGAYYHEAFRYTRPQTFLLCFVFWLICLIATVMGTDMLRGKLLRCMMIRKRA